MSNYIHFKVCNVITNPFPNFNVGLKLIHVNTFNPSPPSATYMSNSPQMGTTPNSKVTLPNLHENAQTNASLYK